MEEIKYLLRMKNIERMSGTYKHRSYNLLEHQYMVGMLFQYFAKEEGMEITLEELNICLTHDYLESATGDLIHPIKNLNEITKSSWEAIEEEVVKKYKFFYKFTDKNINLAFQNERNFNLFKICDYIDLFLFCVGEVNIGNNSSEIEEIYRNSYILINEILLKDNFISVREFLSNFEDFNGYLRKIR